jgi:hypothetical protein
MHSKVNIGKHLSDNVPVQNNLKHRDALSPLFFNFVLEYAIRKVQKNQTQTQRKPAHHLASYVTELYFNIIPLIRQHVGRRILLSGFHIISTPHPQFFNQSCEAFTSVIAS